MNRRRLEKLETRARRPKNGEVWVESDTGSYERLGEHPLVLTPAELEARKETPGLVVLCFGLKA